MQLQAPRIVSLGDPSPKLGVPKIPPGPCPPTGGDFGDTHGTGCVAARPQVARSCCGDKSEATAACPIPITRGTTPARAKNFGFSPLMGPKIVGSSPFGAAGASLGLGFSPRSRTQQKLGRFGGCLMIYRSQLPQLIPRGSAEAAPGRKGEPGARLRPPSRRPPAALGPLRAPPASALAPQGPTRGPRHLPETPEPEGPGPARSQAPPPFSSPRPFPDGRQAPTDDVSSGAGEDTPSPRSRAG